MVVVLITAVQTRPFPRSHGMSYNMQTQIRKDRAEKCYTNTDSISKFYTTDKPMVDNKFYLIQ